MVRFAFDDLREYIFRGNDFVFDRYKDASVFECFEVLRKELDFVIAADFFLVLLETNPLACFVFFAAVIFGETFDALFFFFFCLVDAREFLRTTGLDKLRLFFSVKDFLDHRPSCGDSHLSSLRSLLSVVLESSSWWPFKPQQLPIIASPYRGIDRIL